VASEPFFVAFDIETRQIAKQDGVWHSVRDGVAGITAICVVDSSTKRPYLYDMSSLEACANHLEAADAIVGFNSRDFDLDVIEDFLGRKLRIKHHVDMHRLIQAALKKNHISGPGNTLNDVCQRTIGKVKSGKGREAITLAERGEWAKLFQYCMDDTFLTYELFEYIRAHGGIIGLNGKLLELPLSDWLRLPAEQGSQ
jgi:DNA polymerase elongation subunit (family B)